MDEKRFVVDAKEWEEVAKWERVLSVMYLLYDEAPEPPRLNRATGKPPVQPAVSRLAGSTGGFPVGRFNRRLIRLAG